MNDEQIALLNDILLRRAPDLGNIRDRDHVDVLDSDQRLSIQLVVADELLEQGLTDTEEHTAYGLVLEGLISGLSYTAD